MRGLVQLSAYWGLTAEFIPEAAIHSGLLEGCSRFIPHPAKSFWSETYSFVSKYSTSPFPEKVIENTTKAIILDTTLETT